MWKIINKYSKLSKLLDNFLNPFINFSRKLQNNINPLFSKVPPIDNKLKNNFAGGLWIYAIVSWFSSLISIFRLFPLMMQWFPLLKVIWVFLNFFLTYIYFSSIDWLKHSKKSWYDFLYLATIWEILIFFLNRISWSFNLWNFLMLALVLYILSQTKNNFR